MKNDIKDAIGVIVYWILIFLLIRVLFTLIKAFYNWIKNK